MCLSRSLTLSLQSSMQSAFAASILESAPVSAATVSKIPENSATMETTTMVTDAVRTARSREILDQTQTHNQVPAMLLLAIPGARQAATPRQRAPPSVVLPPVVSVTIFVLADTVTGLRDTLLVTIPSKSGFHGPSKVEGCSSNLALSATNCAMTGSLERTGARRSRRARPVIDGRIMFFLGLHSIGVQAHDGIFDA